MDSKKNLHLASLDGGGPWCFSELLIMKNIMNRLKWDKYGAGANKEVLPCDYYHLIGGSDAGGLLVIMFVTLRMSVDEAIEEFGAIVKQVYAKDLTPEERSQRLRDHMEALLIKKHRPVDLKLEEKEKRRCSGFVLAASTLHATSKVCFRTYRVRDEPPSGVTVVEAALATCASQPHFLPVTINIGSKYERQDYISAALGVNNPVGKVLSEAHLHFGGKAAVVSLLSLGSGNAGVIHYTPDGTDRALPGLVLNMALDCEPSARECQERIGRGILFRLSVEQGLQRDRQAHHAQLASICAHTESYLQIETATVDEYVKRLTSGSTGITLDSLNQVVPAKPIYKEPPVLCVNYVRREAPWKAMAQCLKGIEGRRTVIVIAGMAGCGKTQLALEVYQQYCPRANSHFKHVFFIDGTSEISIQADLIAHVQRIMGPSKQVALEDAMEFLRQNSGWLLIYDGVEEKQTFLPSCYHGTIIITTRNRLLRKMASSPAHNLDLASMSKEEAVTLLLGCTGEAPSKENEEGAGRVADELCRLPLALTQAGCYMSATGCSWEPYLRLVAHHSLMKMPCGDEGNPSTYATLNITYEKLQAHVQNFIHLLSFFHFTHFPSAVITHVATLLSRDNPSSITNSDIEAFQLLKETFLPDGGWSDHTVPSMILVLQKYSLASVTSTPVTPLLHIHPLIHRWASDRLLQSRRSVFERAACRFLVCCREATHLAQYLPLHIGTVMSRVPSEHLCEDDHAALRRILRAARPQNVWLSIRNHFRKGLRPRFLDVVNSAVEFARQFDSEESQGNGIPGRSPNFNRTASLGHRRLETLETMSERSNSLSLQNKHEEALSLQEEVVGKLKNAQLPTDNPTLVKAVAILIQVRRRQQILPDAAVQSPILEEEESQIGEAYLDTLDAMDKLVWNYYQRESLADAEILLYKLLEGCKVQLGEKHPVTLRKMSKLASIYQQLGRPEEAEPLQSQVLEHRKDLLGVTHLDTLDAMCFLASTYCQQERYAIARPLLAELLAGWKLKLGEKHHDTLRAMTGLALVHYHLHEYVEAEELQLKALGLCTALAGKGSRAEATCANDLARTYYQLSRLDDAERFALKAEKVRKELLGVEHHHYKDTAKLIALIQTRGSSGAPSTEPTPSVSTISNESASSSSSIHGLWNMSGAFHATSSRSSDAMRFTHIFLMTAFCLLFAPYIGWLVLTTFAIGLCLLLFL